jgi:DNA-binding MarR family transcriptional regulator
LARQTSESILGEERLRRLLDVGRALVAELDIERLLHRVLDVARELTGAQYAALSVLRRDPALSGADLARACNTTPQAMNGVLATLSRSGLIDRRPHPTHGRILQVSLTAEGARRLESATPAVRSLEACIDEGFTAEEIATVKAWLVAAALRLGP